MRERAGAAVPAYSAAVFRIAFGVIALVVVIRFFANGWIDELLLDPPLHYPYHGLGWIRPWPAPVMYIQFAALAVAAAGIAFGWRYRLSAAVFAANFAYVELIDQTLYINHYYWMALTAGLMVFLPLHRVWSLDARRAGWDPVVPRLAVWVLRFQVGMVYVFAGLAKLSPDWLLHGQPLATWLPARAEMPVIGWLLALPDLAVAASWAGAVFDLTVVALLSWRRTRVPAFAVLVAFHVVTWLLFPSIGVFPWLMIAGSSVFFPPDWPLRLVPNRRWSREGTAPAAIRRVSIPAVAAVAVYVAVMTAVPLRHLASPGDRLWTGSDSAFSWQVMLGERAGTVSFSLTDAGAGTTWIEGLPVELTHRQREVVAASPTLIADTARIIAAAYRAQGREVAVRADAFVSFNGRLSARIIDPTVDLSGDDPPPFLLPAPG